MSSTIVQNPNLSATGAAHYRLMTKPTRTLDGIFKRNLRMLKRAFKLSSKIIAERSGVSERMVDYLLSGDRSPTVDVADHGLQAVQKFEAHHFDLVLMDVQMTVMDGFEATAKIRELEAAGRHITIVAMTANAMAGDRARCLEAGMDDYLPKPVKPAELAELLKRWLAEVPSVVPTMVDLRPPDSVWDFESLSQTCGGDPEFMREVLEEYLRTLPAALERILSDWSTENWQALNQSGHALKGASRSIGANEVAVVCQQFELFGKSPTTAPRPSPDTLQSVVARLRDLMNRYLSRAA